MAGLPARHPDEPKRALTGGNSGTVAFSGEIAMPLNFTAKYGILPEAVRRAAQGTKAILKITFGADQIGISVWVHGDHVSIFKRFMQQRSLWKMGLE